MPEFHIQELLFPNILTVAAQLCATFILFLLCKKLLWGPARNILKARQDKMVSSLENATKLQNEAAAKLQEAKEGLDEAKVKSVEIVESARNEANALREEIVNSAKREAANKLEDAEHKIELRKNEVQNELHDEMVSVAMAAVSKLLEEKATSQDDAKAIEKYVNEAKN